MRQQPVSVVAPCHRVVGADGSLTGYAGGLCARERSPPRHPCRRSGRLVNTPPRSVAAARLWEAASCVAGDQLSGQVFRSAGPALVDRYDDGRQKASQSYADDCDRGGYVDGVVRPEPGCESDGQKNDPSQDYEAVCTAALQRAPSTGRVT
ncbi:MGMT family protein [Nonomuraea muscovyensis]